MKLRGNKNENINDWLEILKDNMDLANVLNDDQVLMASSSLRLNALHYWYSIRSNHPSWTQYVTLFKKQFLPKKYQ